MSDPSNGYLYGDSCVFGVEVFVIKREPVIEYVCLKNFDVLHKRDWKIQNFSKLGDEWKCEEFCVGGHKWKICLHPKGTGEKPGRYISIFLQNVCSKSFKASFAICVKNQLKQPDKRAVTDHSFTASKNDWGWHSFIELAAINDPKKGFVVEDCFLLDVEISSVQDVA
ncbi:PREDICTED: ubiquitin carboxyl-terminal hydrolase 12-like [Erythranthe guttata]|nr:PREDICTED: ubiquitin carboxyl-terminal hydrolase 12-like [Erythranthe guttata]|eukprot:XP_012833021.1 PREDICTED: ubiquitin carboxyl-terminal hydrolase 12-like [Erythranthe guttata]